MSTRFNKLFGTNLVNTQIVSPSGGLPDGFPPAFLSLTKNIDGNVTSWDVYGDTRDTGTITTYGGPAQRRNLQSKSTGKAVLLHTLDSIAMGQAQLNAIINSNGEIDERGEEEIARQTAIASKILVNNRVASVVSMLAYGAIYTAAGQIVDSSHSGASIVADLGIPAANTNTLGGIISAKWDVASTAIATQIENMQRQRLINGTPALRYCGYGPGVSDALLNNTIVAKMIQGGNARLDYGTGIIEGLFNMTWYPVTGNFLKSASGASPTFTNPFAKKVVFHPEPSRDWFEMHQGSYVVGNANTPAYAGDATALARSLQKVRGAFAFADWEGNPASIVHTFGDVWLPVLYQPSAVFIPTVLT